MAEEVLGTSRRTVLRGSAMGVGALVGAMALTNSGEVGADAASGSGHSYQMTMTGIAGNNNKIRLTSLGLGGDNNNGTPTPEVVTVGMATGRHSPLILKAFAQKTNTITATIRGYQPNVQGVTVNSLTITCTGVEIVHYHLGVSSSGAPTDNVQFTFASIDLDWVLQGTAFTWTPVA